MLHGHIEGWTPAEIYRFADSIVKGGEPLAYFTEQPTAGMGHNLNLALDVPKDAKDVSITLYYTTEPPVSYTHLDVYKRQVHHPAGVRAVPEPIHHAHRPVFLMGARYGHGAAELIHGHQKIYSGRLVIGIRRLLAGRLGIQGAEGSPGGIQGRFRRRSRLRRRTGA